MKLLYLLCTLLLNCYVLAQDDKIDQETLDSILSNPKKYNYDLESIKRILEQNKLIGESTLYARTAQYFLVEKEVDSALYFANKAIQTYNEAPIKRDFDEKQLMRAFYVKGRMLTEKSNFKSSVENQLKAIELGEKYDYKWIAYYYTGLASNYMKLGNDSIALHYFSKALNNSAYMNIPKAALSTYNRAGLISMNLGKFKEAKNYFYKGIQLSEKDSQMPNLGPLCANIGEVFFKEQKQDSVIYYYRKAIVAYASNREDQEPSFYESSIRSYINIFEGRNTLKEIDALNSLISEIQNEKEVNKHHKTAGLIAFRGLGIAYTRENKSSEYEDLVYRMPKFLELFFQKQFDEDIDVLEFQYKTREKDQAIVNLSLKEKGQNIIIKQQRYLWMGLILLVILLIISGILFYRQRKVQFEYKNENLKQRLLRSQLNPHFIFSNINSIINLHQEDSSNLVPYLHKFSSLLRLTIKNSREEFVSLDNEITSIKDYLELQSNFSKKFTYQIEIDQAIDNENLFIPPMFIQPFVENSIEHGFQNKKDETIKILINTNKKRTLLNCQIIDNGRMNHNLQIPKRESFSSQIIEERLKIYSKRFKVKAYYSMKSNHPEGTTVNLSLPIIEE